MRTTPHLARHDANPDGGDSVTGFASQVAGIVEELARCIAMLPEVGGREPAFIFPARTDTAKTECCR